MACRGNINYARLSIDIEEKYKSNRQSQDEYDRKDRWRAHIENIITRKHPDCRLVLYGSSASGSGSSGCDIDLSLFLPSLFGRPSLYDINACFTQIVPRRFVTEVVSTAVVPILKLNDKVNSYESDISVNNMNGISNTFLMSCYHHADPRVTPLIVVVKLWAAKADIKGARFHRLSGFALALLVLHYLQAGCYPPVIPALQSRFPSIIPSNRNAIIDHLKNRTVPTCVSSLARSANTQSLGELLVGFFQYYCSFSWRDTISVRIGGTKSTPFSKKWQNPYIRMEDPTDLTNVTRSVYKLYQFGLIKDAFKSANSNLGHGLSLNSIF